MTNPTTKESSMSLTNPTETKPAILQIPDFEKIKNKMLLKEPGLLTEQEPEAPTGFDIKKEITASEVKNLLDDLEEILADQGLSSDDRRFELQSVLAGLEEIAKENFDQIAKGNPGLVSINFATELETLQSSIAAQVGGLGLETSEEYIGENQKKCEQEIQAFAKRGGYGFLSELSKKIQESKGAKKAFFITGGALLGLGFAVNTFQFAHGFAGEGAEEENDEDNGENKKDNTSVSDIGQAVKGAVKQVGDFIFGTAAEAGQDEDLEGAKTSGPLPHPDVDQIAQEEIKTEDPAKSQLESADEFKGDIFYPQPAEQPEVDSTEHLSPDAQFPSWDQSAGEESIKTSEEPQNTESQPTPDQLQNATVHQGEGIEHALQRQLETNQPLAKELYKQSYGGVEHAQNLTPQEIDALSHRLAIQNDYVDSEGNEVRVNIPDKVAYVLDDRGGIQEKNLSGQILESDTGDLDSAKGKLEDYEYKHEPQVETAKAATPTTESADFFGRSEIKSTLEDAARVGDDMLEQAKAHQEILEKSSKQLSHEQKIQQAANQQEQLNKIINRYGISDKAINEITVKDFLTEDPRILQHKLDPDFNWSSQEASEMNERTQAIEKLKTLITENGGADPANQNLSVNEFFQNRLDNARQLETPATIQETPIPKSDLAAIKTALSEVTDTFKDDILNLPVNELIANESNETAYKVQMTQTAYNDSPQLSTQIAELRKTLENIPEADRHQESLKDFFEHQKNISASSQTPPPQEVQTESPATKAATGAVISEESAKLQAASDLSQAQNVALESETSSAPYSFVDPEKYQEAVKKIQSIENRAEVNEKIQGLDRALARFVEYSTADDDSLKEVSMANELAEKLNEMYPGLINADKYHADDSSDLEINNTLSLKETLDAAEKIIKDAKTKSLLPPGNLPTTNIVAAETQKEPAVTQQLEALHAETLQKLVQENPKLDTHIKTLQKDAGLKLEELSVRGDKIVFFDQALEASDFQRISSNEFKILKAQHELVDQSKLDPTVFENLVKIAATPNIELKQAFIIENNPNVYKFEVKKPDNSKISVFAKSSGLEQKDLIFSDAFKNVVSQDMSPAAVINFRSGGSLDLSSLDENTLKTFEDSLKEGKLPGALVEQKVQKTADQIGAGESLEAQASADLEQKFDAIIEKILDDQTLMQKLQQNLDQDNAGIDLRQKLETIKQYNLTISEDAKKAESFARIIGEIVMKPEIGASPAIKKGFAEFLETLASTVK